MDWRDPLTQGFPEENCICLVSLKGGHGTVRTVFRKSNQTFLLDAPQTQYALIPVAIDYYLIIPECPN